MVGAPYNARTAIAGAILSQPWPHVPPRHDRIPRAAEMIDGKGGGPSNRGRLVLCDKEVAAGDDVAVHIVRAVFNELCEFFSCSGAVAEAFRHVACVELAEATKEPNRDAFAGGLGELNTPWP